MTNNFDYQYTDPRKMGSPLGKPQGSAPPRCGTIMLLAFLWSLSKKQLWPQKYRYKTVANSECMGHIGYITRRMYTIVGRVWASGNNVQPKQLLWLTVG